MDELRGVNDVDAVGVVVVVDQDGLRDFCDGGALDHGKLGVHGQAEGDVVRGLPVHDLNRGVRVLGDAVRDGVTGLGQELLHGHRGGVDVHLRQLLARDLCTGGETGVVAGVLVGDSGVMLAGWVGRSRGSAREGRVGYRGLSFIFLKGGFHPTLRY